jgi:hypothetical protein
MRSLHESSHDWGRESRVLPFQPDASGSAGWIEGNRRARCAECFHVHWLYQRHAPVLYQTESGAGRRLPRILGRDGLARLGFDVPARRRKSSVWKCRRASRLPSPGRSLRAAGWTSPAVGLETVGSERIFKKSRNRVKE